MINTLPTRARELTPEEAKEERDFRELAKTRYKYYRHYINPKFKDGRHHAILAYELEQIELFIRTRGKEGNGRLIVELPPQHGKTTDIARIFPSWVIGRNPNTHVGIVSYGANLADKHSAAVRDYVQSEAFRNLFGTYSTNDEPVMLSDDSASRSDWRLRAPHEGGCLSRGISGGLSGNPLDLLIVDDPTSDIDEGRSEIHQKKLENWFDSVAIPRLSEWGACIIDHTRWDPNDLIGQILQRMANEDPNIDQWRVVYLPAMALEPEQYPETEEEYKSNLSQGVYLPMRSEGDPLKRQPGQVLWPWRYSQAYIEKIKTTIEAKSPYTFASVYQQLPRPFTGGLFDANDIKEIDRIEVDWKWEWVSYIDVALGRNKRSDFNASLIETLTPDGDIVARDLLRIRELNKFLKLLKMAMLLEDNKKVIWGLEDVAFQSLAFQNFWNDPELAAIKMITFPVPEGSKLDRAMNLSLRAKEGHFKLVKGSNHKEVVRQLMEYPYSQHDDIVDTASGGPYMIAQLAKKKHLEAKIL